VSPHRRIGPARHSTWYRSRCSSHPAAEPAAKPAARTCGTPGRTVRRAGSPVTNALPARSHLAPSAQSEPAPAPVLPRPCLTA
jgi:hypothetical protein